MNDGLLKYGLLLKSYPFCSYSGRY